MNQATNTAIAFRIITELYRKNHLNYDFHIYNLHPCGGMYNTLDIYHKEEHLCAFNLQSGNYHIFKGGQNSDFDLGYGSTYIEKNSFREAYTKGDKIKTNALIAKSIGLNNEQMTPQSTAKVLALRLLASLAETFCENKTEYTLTCGWVDTPQNNKVDEQSSEYWTLQKELVIGYNGKAYKISQPNFEFDFWNLYCNNGRKFEPVVDEMLKMF